MLKRIMAIGILIGFIPLPIMASVLPNANPVTYVDEPTTEIVVVEEEETTTYVSEIIEPSTEKVTTVISGITMETEPVTEMETETTTVVVPETQYTDEEVELLALVMLAEAEGESELGQRLVVDVILNRVDSDRHPNTIHDVVYQKGQFTPMWNGRINRVTVTDEARALVREELESRTNYDVVYFRMYRYHNFGTRLFKEGCHYFSGY